MLPGGRMFASFDGVDFVRWKAPAELLKLRLVVSIFPEGKFLEHMHTHSNQIRPTANDNDCMKGLCWPLQ